MSVAENLNAIDKTISKICKKRSYDKHDVELVAVSKRQPLDKIKALLDSGHLTFGENIIQDAIQTWEKSGFIDQYPDLKLHFIGSLQTNKAEDAVLLFDVIETVDRPKLVDAIVKASEKHEKSVECYIQVNTGDEPQKSGVLPADLDDLVKYAKNTNLNVTGLMCIPPQNEPSALHFAFLKTLAERHGLKNISMGMSDDFEKAINLGATHIRIGTAIFGERSSEASSER